MYKFEYLHRDFLTKSLLIFHFFGFNSVLYASASTSTEIAAIEQEAACMQDAIAELKENYESVNARISNIEESRRSLNCSIQQLYDSNMYTRQQLENHMHTMDAGITVMQFNANNNTQQIESLLLQIKGCVNLGSFEALVAGFRSQIERQNALEARIESLEARVESQIQIIFGNAAVVTGIAAGLERVGRDLAQVQRDQNYFRSLTDYARTLVSLNTSRTTL